MASVRVAHDLTGLRVCLQRLLEARHIGGGGVGILVAEQPQHRARERGHHRQRGDGIDHGRLEEAVRVEVDEDAEALTPTVSPSTIPLVYYHINSFQQASSVERPLPGGAKRTAGRASHHEEWCSDWVVSPPVWTAGLSLIAVWGMSGATPRGQPWTPAVTLPHSRHGLSVRRMAV